MSYVSSRSVHSFYSSFYARVSEVWLLRELQVSALILCCSFCKFLECLKCDCCMSSKTMHSKLEFLQVFGVSMLGSKFKCFILEFLSQQCCLVLKKGFNLRGISAQYVENRHVSNSSTL
ncbi:hypothetical protein O6H91_20G011700 [Diphasiastrum complanatum]|uniref:Uncharacterized protein n=1 Tax=Diphasiastrum complanatum TaxID=34168 RepID=A0ACC2APH7_DIPCM|nr:hypothetical protein O6H91_20G011700 [Diphasiastrum complanatum]